jgi:predicted CXXCH cytochrome family protein
MRRAARRVLLAMIGMAVVAGSATLAAQEPPEQAIVAFQDDVHARSGFTCVACHGPAVQPPGGGPEVYAPIPRTEIAPMCARCHADAAFMRQYAPQVRVDQYAQYLTSVHGQQMAAGEVAVATCSDCHAPHGILEVRDTRSPVAPTNVARTCARCHTDEAVMGPFGRSTAVFDDWSTSVHAEALLERGDRSAPTCSTCHGSHGATPPGVESVAHVCAQCHVREAELFGNSIKDLVFEAMGLSDCLVCHNNHAIARPDQTWIGLESPAVCAMCHDESSSAAATITAYRTGFDDLLARTDEADALLTRAEEAGVLVDDGHLKLREARQASIQMRVLVHAFDAGPFSETLDEGLAAVTEAHSVGESALAELDFRRRGLAIATLFILGFLVTLFVKIRRLPPIEA